MKQQSVPSFKLYSRFFTHQQACQYLYNYSLIFLKYDHSNAHRSNEDRNSVGRQAHHGMAEIRICSQLK